MKFLTFARHLLMLFMLFFPAGAQAQGVIVSIKPLHSLVSAIMGDTGKPTLLIEGTQSPHGYQLKPSQISALHEADIIFYTAPELESFLVRPMESLPENVRKIALIEARNIKILPRRSGGLWEEDEDEPSSPSMRDPHIWLNPDNAKALAHEIMLELSAQYPERAEIYRQNEMQLEEKLDRLKGELSAGLVPYKNKPFIVFHDAYQYFEEYFGLSGAGSITLEPEQEPGIKRISEIREKLRASNVTCVLAEPQFSRKLVETVTNGTQAKTGILDPIGADIEAGPELYFTMMKQMAGNLQTCLNAP